MGATGWKYFIPYQTDVKVALQQLREQVFQQDAYERPTISLEFLEEIGFFEAEEQERETMFSEYTLEPLRKQIALVGLSGLEARLLALEAAPKLNSMEELHVLLCLSESGTGSILDVALSDLFPLSLEQVQILYGTAQPGREQMEGRSMGRSLYKRGEGFYTVVYKEGQPDEYYFEGASGD